MLYCIKYFAAVIEAYGCHGRLYNCSDLDTDVSTKVGLDCR